MSDLVHTSIRLKRDQKERLQREANQYGLSFSGLLRLVCEKHLRFPETGNSL